MVVSLDFRYILEADLGAFLVNANLRPVAEDQKIKDCSAFTFVTVCEIAEST